MLDRLIVENVKGFGPRQEAELAPITLIYGPNSGGKSTLIQALLLLKQTLEVGDGIPPELVTHGPLINAGSFAAVLHRQDLDRTMRIGVTYSDRHDADRDGMRGATGRDYVGQLSVRQELVTVDFGFRCPEDERVGRQVEVTLGVGERLPVCTFTAHPVHEFACRFAGPAARAAWLAWMRREVEERSAYARQDPEDRDHEFFLEHHAADALGAATEFNIWFPVRGHFPGAMEWEYLYGQEDIDPYQLSRKEQLYWEGIEKTWQAWTDYYDRVLRKRLGELTYLGPLRRAPERYHFDTGESEGGVGFEGENIWQLLEHDVGATLKVNEWLERLQIPYRLTVERMEERVFNDLLLVRLIDRRNETAVSPRDVGFGVSQVLPLVVAALQLGSGVLCVEQPELHLHPRLQAELADLFIECTRSTTNYPRGQVLIETHSEALMLRIQRRIREGKIRPDDVSVLYVDPDGGPATRVERLRLDRLGRFIDEWPGGFFEERLNETLLGFEN